MSIDSRICRRKIFKSISMRNNYNTDFRRETQEESQTNQNKTKSNKNERRN